MTDLLYVYTVLPADSPAVVRLRKEPLAGIDGRAVLAITEGPLAAAVSEVPAADFAEEPLNLKLRDLDWLAPRAAQHQQANALLLERADALLPLSFGTIYHDAAGVRRMLRADRPDLEQRLATVRGRAEWIATLQRDREAALAALDGLSPAVRALATEIAASAPGRAYLLRRRLAELHRSELRELDARVAEDARERLDAAAERIYPEPLLEGVAQATLARFSLLAARGVEARLVEIAKRCTATWGVHGYTLQVSGPWPPYRFAGLPLGATSGAA